MKERTERSTEYERLVDLHQGILYRTALAYAQTREDLEDLVQEIRLQLWASFSSYDSTRLFSTWMYRVALNTALSWDRKARTRPRTEGYSQAQEAQAPQGDWALAQTLRDLVEGLSPMERAMTLLYLEGQSHMEIGEVMGITAANAAVKLSRIKERLRRQAGARE